MSEKNAFIPMESWSIQMGIIAYNTDSLSYQDVLNEANEFIETPECEYPSDLFKYLRTYARDKTWLNNVERLRRDLRKWHSMRRD